MDFSVSSISDTSIPQILPPNRTGIFISLMQTLRIFIVFIIKTHMILLRRWFYVIGTYLGIIIFFLCGIMTLREFYPYPHLKAMPMITNKAITKEWVSPPKPMMEGAVLIGYTPRFPLIEATMEEVERILIVNGLPPGVKEFQTVPFKSEYSMAKFIRDHPGVLKYAFAFSTKDQYYPSISSMLNIASYIHDMKCEEKYNDYILEVYPCSGDVYVAKVIMEAFMHAHTGKDHNMSLSYLPITTTPRRLDPILAKKALRALDDLYSICLTFIIWAIVYHIAKERENGIQVTLHRMGLSESYNFAASILSLQFHIFLLVLCLYGIMMVPVLHNTPIITNSNPIIVIIFILCYSLSIMSYCVLTSVLFPKARQCVMVACSLFVLGVYLDSHWYPPSVIHYATLFGSAATQKGLMVLMQMEKNARGLQWNNTDTSFFMYGTQQRHLSIKWQMLLLLVSIPTQLILAAVVAVWRSSVWPLCLQGLQWPWEGYRVLATFRQNMENCEGPPEGTHPCVVMNRVYTEGKVPIIDINWTVYMGEVSVAMGLENSGRKSVLNVLYGETKPVSGTATVFGLDSVHQSHLIRQNCSNYSPDINTLFPDLTVKDNLHIFLELKSLCQQRRYDNIDDLVQCAKLDDVIDTPVWKLKPNDLATLKIVVAFLGDSKLVILEDPTKDLPIHTRMRIWNIIGKHSEGRSVILSTMCMEEAQTIGDRITIFKDGHINCSGTVPYLRSIFGTGYYLTIHKRRASNAQTLKVLCQFNYPTCVCVRDEPRCMVFLMPTTEGPQSLESLLESLEQHQVELGILNYDIQGSTLENAFFNLTTGVNPEIGKQMDKTEELNKLLEMRKSGSTYASRRSAAVDLDTATIMRHSAYVEQPLTDALSVTRADDTSKITNEMRAKFKAIGTESQDERTDEGTTDIGRPQIERLKGLRLYLARLKVVMTTRLLSSARRMDKELVQGLLMIALVVYYRPDNMDIEELTGEQVVDHTRFPDQGCPGFVALGLNSEGFPITKHPATLDRLWKTLTDVHHGEIMSPCTSVLEYASSEKRMEDFILSQSATHGIPLYGIKLTPTEEMPLSATLYISRRSPSKSLLPALAAVMEAFIRFETGDNKIMVRLQAMFPPPSHFKSDLSNKAGVVATIIFIFIPYYNINKRSRGTTMSQQLSGASPLIRFAANFVNDMINYIFLAIIYFLIIEYTLHISPEPSETDYMLAMILLYGAVMITHIYCLSMFFNNPLLGTAVIMCFIFFSADVVSRYYLGTAHEIKHVFLLLPAYLLPGYLYFFYHNHNSARFCPNAEQYCSAHVIAENPCCATTLLPIHHTPYFFLGIGLAHLVFWTSCLFFVEYGFHNRLHRFIKGKLSRQQQLPTKRETLSGDVSTSSKYRDSREAASTLANILTSATGSPSQTFPASEFQPTERSAGTDEMSTHQDRANKQASDAVSQGRPSVSVASSSCVDRQGMILGALASDEKGYNDWASHVLQARESESEMFEAEDGTLKSDSGNLNIQDLSLSPTLKDISVTVTPGEIFCFVSADNEATSEVLRCICGLSTSYSGLILMDGKPIGLEHPMSPLTIGYAPRDQPLGFTSTPRESLTLCCTLRGVICVSREVKSVLRLLKLTPYADLSAKRMSDCTLQRYRIAKAIVGEPDIILLDRPLTGLDSTGKVTVWNAIHRLKSRGKVVIMTSNSIDSCEDLATRVAILVRGQVVVVSPPSGIRSQFSNSYSLTAKLSSNDKKIADIVIPSLTQRFPNSEIFVDSLNYLHILLPFRTDSLADIFRLMESVKKHLKTSDFVLRHATMDNVIKALEERDVTHMIKRTSLSFITKSSTMARGLMSLPRSLYANRK